MTVAGETHRCPPPEVLAAFIDGRLPRLKVVALTEHLATCAECRFVVESASELEAEEQGESVEPKAARAWRWQSIAAIIAAALVATPFGQLAWRWQVRERAMRELRETPLKERLIEPRLTGFEYVEKPTRMRSFDPEPQEPDDVLIAKVKAGQVILDTQNDSSAAAAHDRGIAYVMRKDAVPAINELRKSVQKQPDNAKAWSDLSAAYFVANQHPQAIAAADRAIALDPKLDEARFNKALATNSIAGWNEYLKHAPQSRWRIEAQTRHDDLLPITR